MIGGGSNSVAGVNRGFSEEVSVELISGECTGDGVGACESKCFSLRKSFLVENPWAPRAQSAWWPERKLVSLQQEERVINEAATFIYICGSAVVFYSF